MQRGGDVAKPTKKDLPAGKDIKGGRKAGGGQVEF
jgi:hypothetical protein